jgi:ketosteroid isomerase-like protein
MSTTEEALSMIERFNEAFNQHDEETVMKLMTDDIVFENTSGGRFEGREAVRGVLIQAFALMSEGWFDTEEVFGSGDRCVVLWVYRFHRQNPERGQVRGVDIFRVRDALVAEKFSYIKSEEFVQQLGLQIPRA